MATLTAARISAEWSRYCPNLYNEVELCKIVIGGTTMAIKPLTAPKCMLADKRPLREAMAKLNARLGFVPDPDATPEKIREMIRADGVRAEANAFSREIIRMRYEEE
jgi:hypothetical protein